MCKNSILYMYNNHNRHAASQIWVSEGEADPGSGTAFDLIQEEEMRAERGKESNQN